ncbi:MAG: hypothetical protein KAG53_03660 [Endozoicomonadaceae bacterium]|nr:hypothetical protein [Endozoicomonadaceae bacterium]
MISYPNRQAFIRLITEAVDSSAGKQRACEEIGISIRTLQRWTKGGGITEN